MLVELHVLVIPPLLWAGRFRTPPNSIISETLSVGFVRVHAELPLSELRSNIRSQLDSDLLPQDVVFCKLVGRSFAEVQTKQEEIMKVKHFLPPHSFCPEIFLLDANQSQRTSSSTRTESQVSNNPVVKLQQPVNVFQDSSRELENQDDSNQTNKNNQQNNRNSRVNNVVSFVNEDLIKLQIHDQPSSNYNKDDNVIKQQQTFTYDPFFPLPNIESKLQPNLLNYNSQPKNDVKYQPVTLPFISSETIAFQRRNLEILSKAVDQKRQELMLAETYFYNRLKQLQDEEAQRNQFEVERQKEFENLEEHRRKLAEDLLNRQRLELEKLELELSDKKQLFAKEFEHFEAEKNKHKEKEEKLRVELDELKLKIDQEMQEYVMENGAEKLQNLRVQIEEEENKQRLLEEETLKEREKAEKELNKLLMEYDADKQAWEDDRKRREEERNLRLKEEMRLRELAEKRRMEHEALMKEEMENMITIRKRFEDQYNNWQEENRKLEEVEKLRKENDDARSKEVFDNRPLVAELRVKDNPAFILTHYVNTDGFSKAELVQHLEHLRTGNNYLQKTREDLIKHTRAVHNRTQNRRNHVRDSWKKKYCDEKKRTELMETFVDKAKAQLSTIQSRLLENMESGFKDNKKHMISKALPSEELNRILQKSKLDHEVGNLLQQVENLKVKLVGEIKLKIQAELDLKALKVQLTQKKINLTIFRSQQLAALQNSGSSFLPISSVINSALQTPSMTPRLI